MPKKFPPAMVAFTSDPMLKKVLLLEYIQAHKDDCDNCGGMGRLYVFAATEGPYQSPAAPYRGDGKVSKWHDGKWWVGATASFTCPVCGGLGYVETGKPRQYTIGTRVALAPEGTVEQLAGRLKA